MKRIRSSSSSDSSSDNESESQGPVSSSIDGLSSLQMYSCHSSFV